MNLLTRLTLKIRIKVSYWLIWEFIKHGKTLNLHKCKISTPTYEFDLLDESYSISDIQDYFESIIKKEETVADNSPIQISSIKIENHVVLVYRSK